ncbi:MAG: lipopolysaccharide biosynthesis protein [Bacteroidetes bacterium]|nr:lipopolysaccharide biosynthesis protein [Bacteroidota bacterium]
MAHLNLAKATVKGVFWNYATFAVGKILVFITTVVLARLLDPKEFGLMAMALIIINFLTRLQNIGVADAFIYNQQESPHIANTAFFLSVFFGLFFTVFTFFTAPLVGSFFQEPQVAAIIQALSAWFIIVNLGSIHEASLRKALDFRRRLIPEVTQRVFKGGISIALAILGYGVWSLVWGQLVGVLVATVLYWYISKWSPAFTFDIKIMQSLLHYGSQTVFLKMLQGIIRNIDYLIIGRCLGSVELGVYTIAFKLPEILIEGIQSALVPAIFPAYAKIKSEPDILKKGFLLTLQYVSIISLPISLGIFFISSDFVEFFFTEKWVAAVPVMQALSLYAFINSFDAQINLIYRATGRLNTANVMGCIKVIISIPVLLLSSRYGLVAVSISQVLIAIVINCMQLMIVVKITDIRFREIFQSLKPSFICSCVMVPGLITVDMLFNSPPAIIRLLALTLAGTLLYFSTLFLTNRTLFHQTIHFLRHREKLS